MGTGPCDREECGRAVCPGHLGSVFGVILGVPSSAPASPTGPAVGGAGNDQLP